MNDDIYHEYRRLHDAGIPVNKQSQIRFNSGSETLKHKIAKTVVAHVVQQHDYRVDSEVEIANAGVVDIVAWGLSDRLTYAIEVETSPTQGTLQDKANRYVRGPIDDMLSINVTEMPTNYLEAQQYVREELGL